MRIETYWLGGEEVRGLWFFESDPLKVEARRAEEEKQLQMYEAEAIRMGGYDSAEFDPTGDLISSRKRSSGQWEDVAQVKSTD